LISKLSQSLHKGLVLVKFQKPKNIPSGPAPKTTEILSLGVDGKTWGLLLVEGA